MGHAARLGEGGAGADGRGCCRSRHARGVIVLNRSSRLLCVACAKSRRERRGLGEGSAGAEKGRSTLVGGVKADGDGVGCASVRTYRR